MANQENLQTEKENLVSSQAVEGLIPKTCRKPKNILVIALAVIIGLGVISVGVLAYFKYYEMTSQDILRQMMINISNVKSIDYSTEIKIKTKLSEGYQESLAELGIEEVNNSDLKEIIINYDHFYDASVIDSPKNHFSLTSSFDVLSEKLNSLELEAIALNSITYFKLDKVPTIGIFDLSSVLVNKWWSISLDDVLGDMKEYGDMETQDERAIISELSAEQKEELKNIFVDSNVFEISSELPDEEINGLDCYHYLLNINKEEIKNIIESRADILADTEVFFEDTTSMVEESLSKIEFSPVEVWISKDEYLPTKISFIANVSNFGEFELFEINFVFLIKSFNQTLSIEAPEPIYSFEELLGEMFGVVGSTEDVSVLMEDDALFADPNNVVDNGSVINEQADVDNIIIDSELDSDGDGLSDNEEVMIYKTDHFNVDSDGDGYSDFEEIESGYNPLGSGKFID